MQNGGSREQTPESIKITQETVSHPLREWKTASLVTFRPRLTCASGRISFGGLMQSEMRWTKACKIRKLLAEQDGGARGGDKMALKTQHVKVISNEIRYYVYFSRGNFVENPDFPRLGVEKKGWSFISVFLNSWCVTLSLCNQVYQGYLGKSYVAFFLWFLFFFCCFLFTVRWHFSKPHHEPANGVIYFPLISSFVLQWTTKTQRNYNENTSK